MSKHNVWKDYWEPMKKRDIVEYNMRRKIVGLRKLVKKYSDRLLTYEYLLDDYLFQVNRGLDTSYFTEIIDNVKI